MDYVLTESEGSTKRRLVHEVLEIQHGLVDDQTDSGLMESEKSMWKYLECEVHQK